MFFSILIFNLEIDLFILIVEIGNLATMGDMVGLISGFLKDVISNCESVESYWTLFSSIFKYNFEAFETLGLESLLT